MTKHRQAERARDGARGRRPDGTAATRLAIRVAELLSCIPPAFPAAAVTATPANTLPSTELWSPALPAAAPMQDPALPCSTAAPGPCHMLPPLEPSCPGSPSSPSSPSKVRRLQRSVRHKARAAVGVRHVPPPRGRQWGASPQVISTARSTPFKVPSEEADAAGKPRCGTPVPVLSSPAAPPPRSPTGTRPCSPAGPAVDQVGGQRSPCTPGSLPSLAPPAAVEDGAATAAAAKAAPGSGRRPSSLAAHLQQELLALLRRQRSYVGAWRQVRRCRAKLLLSR